MQRHQRDVQVAGRRKTVLLDCVPSSGGLWSYRSRPLEPPLPPRGRSRASADSNPERRARTRSPRPTKASSGRNTTRSTSPAKSPPPAPHAGRSRSAVQRKIDVEVEKAVQAAVSEARVKAEADRARAVASATGHARQTIATLRKRLETIEPRLEEVNGKLAVAESELEPLRERASAADAATKKVHQLRTRLADTKATIAQLEEKTAAHEDLHKRVEILRQQLEETAATDANLREQSARLERELAEKAELAKRAESMGSELQTLQAQLEERTKALQDAQAEVARLETMQSRTPTPPGQLEEAVLAKDAICAECEDLRQKYEQCDRERAEACAKVADTEAMLAEVNAQLETQGETMKHLQAQLEEAQRVKAASVSPPATPTGDCCESCATLAEKLKQHKALQAKLQEAEKALAEVKDASQAELVKTAAEVKAAKTSQAEAVAAMAKAEQTLARKNRELLDASSKANSLQKQLQEAEQSVGEFETKVDELEKELNRRNKTIVAKRNEAEQLRKSLESSQQTAVSMEEKCKELESQLVAQSGKLRRASKESLESKNELEQELATRNTELDQAKQELAETRAQLNTKQEEYTKLKDSLDEIISDRIRLQTSVVKLGSSLDDSRARVEQLEAEVRNYAVEAAKPKPATPTGIGSSHGDSPVPEHPLALPAGSNPDRLHVRLDSGRLLPYHIVHGDDFISTECRSVSKLFLRHQVALQDILHYYSPDTGRMDLAQYQRFVSDFRVVPAIASEDNALEMFRSVQNMSPVEDRETLGSDGFAEALARIAVFYLPGDFDFTGGSQPAIATNKHYGMAFETLLCHLHENSPPSLALALPSHVKPRSATPPALLVETTTKAIAEAEAAKMEASEKDKALADANARIAQLIEQLGAREPVSSPDADVALDRSKSPVLLLHDDLQAVREQLQASKAEIEGLQHALGTKDLELTSCKDTIAALKQELSKTNAKLEENSRAQSFGVPAAGTDPAGLGSGRPCVRYGNGRIIPTGLISGNELICNVNQAACRLLLQHQVVLNRIVETYAPSPSKDLQLEEALAITKAFNIVPELCPERDLVVVHETINKIYDEEGDEDDEIHNLGEVLAEILVRVALLYSPGTYDFVSNPDIRSNPDFGEAFRTLLSHMKENTPESLSDISFPSKPHK